MDCIPFTFIPYGSVIQIIKRTKWETFALMNQSCKWISKMISENRSSFVKFVDTELFIHLSDVQHKTEEEIFEKIIKPRQFLKYAMISFRNFGENREDLEKVMKCFERASIFGECLHLDKCLLHEKMFKYFKPTDFSLNFYNRQKITVFQDNLPHNLNRIRAQVSSVELFLGISKQLLGRSQIFEIICFNIETDIVLETMKSLSQLNSTQKVRISFSESFDLDKITTPFHKSKIFLTSKGEICNLIVFKGDIGVVVAGYFPERMGIYITFSKNLESFKENFIDELKFARRAINSKQILEVVTPMFGK